MDTYAQLSIIPADQMKNRLHIQFMGERGQDVGGLLRDFYIELSREMFNPNYSLFTLSSSGSTYYPDPKSYQEKDHLKYFRGGGGGGGGARGGGGGGEGGGGGALY